MIRREECEGFIPIFHVAPHANLWQSIHARVCSIWKYVVPSEEVEYPEISDVFMNTSVITSNSVGNRVQLTKGEVDFDNIFDEEVGNSSDHGNPWNEW